MCNRDFHSMKDCIKSDRFAELFSFIMSGMACEGVIAVTGVACMFKTSILRLWSKRGYSVGVGDYAQDVQKVPEFTKKLDNPELEMEYILHVLSKHKTYKKVIDRTPADSLLYHFIFQKLNEDVAAQEDYTTLDEILAKVCDRTLKHLPYRVIVLVPKTCKLVADRMKKRGNALDDLGERYVQIQKHVFEFVGALCGWKIFEVDNFEEAYIVLWENVFKGLTPSSSSVSQQNETVGIEFVNMKDDENAPEFEKVFPFRRGTEDSAGWDIPIRSNVSISPMGREKIATGCKIKLPRGYHAKIAPRSSTFEKCIDIFPGIIDSDYRGEIILGVVNQNPRETVHLKGGDLLAQLIVYKNVNAVFPLKTCWGETERGEGGFGSTDKKRKCKHPDNGEYTCE